MHVQPVTQVVLWLALLGVAWPAELVRGKETAASEERAAIGELFELGSKVSPKSLAAARARYEELRPGAGDVGSLDHAFAVVLVQQRHYEEAVGLLDGVLKRRPTSAAAWQLKIWSQAADRKLPAALIDMQAAARALARPVGQAAQRESESEGLPEQAALAEFFGRMLGYFAGPRTGAISQAKLARARQAVLEQYPAQRAAFEAGEKQVLDQFAEHKQVLEEAEKEAQQSGKKSQELSAAKLKEERVAVGEQVAEVEINAEQVKEGVKAKLAELQSQERPLETQLLKLRFEIDRMQTALGQIQLQIDTAAAARQNTSTSTPAPLQLVVLNNNAVQLQTQIVNLGSQMAGINVRLATIAAQRAELLGQGEAVTHSLQQQSKRLRQNVRRLVGKEKKVATSHPAQPARVHALRDAEHLLSTYEPFSYAAATASVLNSLSTGAKPKSSRTE